MLGFMVNEQEQKELVYMIKRELEEILLDIGDHRISRDCKMRMEKRYDVLLNLLARVSSRSECLEYVQAKDQRQSN
ncbi:hypothetical protein G4V62_17505 [Bacillaceae bacterium SIJ1]|uniref:hypothetical protein n=1 Tax=Litoribacterium kuwaitense TaxID=1398745 RepID=UPI0013EB76AA|nr:hypothetical protein [Litoribacterium kuwaitense]NGP46653.1 hypothetical protein [Litoribacterium kuwaitense]